MKSRAASPNWGIDYVPSAECRFTPAAGNVVRSVKGWVGKHILDDLYRTSRVRDFPGQAGFGKALISASMNSHPYPFVWFNIRKGRINMSLALEIGVRYDSLLVSSPYEDHPPQVRTLEDSELVSRAQQGDVQAFEVLVNRYRNDVFALSTRFVRNREEAWDISQEVFVKAYRSLKRFRGDAGFKTWLLRITANHSKDWLKKRRLDTVAFDDRIESGATSSRPDPGQSAVARELGETIQKAIDQLPHKHKLAFVLREFEGLSYQEMAEVMQCSQGTVMSRLHHARKKLQNALTEMGVRGGG